MRGVFSRDGRQGRFRAACRPAKRSRRTRAFPWCRVAAVIPAYNEAAMIGRVVAGTRRHVDRVMVIDDGSTDGTARRAARAGAEVIALPANRGKAAAVMAGFSGAIARGYDVVVMLDGDGQHLPEEIPRVLAPVLAGSADLVIGSRFLDVRSAIPAYRVVGQKALNLATAIGAGVFLTDTQSGFRALGPGALSRLDFASTGYGLESEMIAHYAACGLSITEVPVGCSYDGPNLHKKHPLLHGLEIVNAMARTAVVRQRRALGVAGVPLVLAGPLLGFAPAVLSSPDSWTPGLSAAALGAVTALGVLLIAGSRAAGGREGRRSGNGPPARPCESMPPGGR